MLELCLSTLEFASSLPLPLCKAESPLEPTRFGSSLVCYICTALYGVYFQVQKEKVIKEVSMLLSEAGFNLKEDIELHDPVDSSMEVEQQNEAAQEPYKSSRMLQDRNTVDGLPVVGPMT